MEPAADEVPKGNSGNVLPASSTAENTATPPPQDTSKKSKKDDRSKKDDKNIEQFMKSLNSIPTLDEKLSLVCEKYVQTADHNRKLQFYIKQSDKRYALLIKEKEQLQHEYNKTVLVKSKLEDLCRELQKQNKAIKEKGLLLIREEEERRKEAQSKFQNTLSEITTLLHQNDEKNAKLRDDNINTTEKFKSVVQQYQLREQQVEKMTKQMSLESQLSEAKLQKAALEHQAEKERLLADMETLKVNLAQLRAKNMELQGNESGLRSQLAVYTDKYDEFQNALVKSNQVFGGFKEQMEKMSKKIQKLEKESLSWKKRWETSQTALLDMCGERQASEEKAAAAARHLTQMQSLCRTLQAERTLLLNSLKEHNIERPPLPTPPPAPAPTTPPAPAPTPTPATNTNVDAMAANCVQLRQSLAHLQTQLNVLTNKKEESPKPEKAKKSKSKKNKADKKLAQEKESATNVKDSSEESQANSEEQIPQDKAEENKEEKVDSKTMESLIQPISTADINNTDIDDSENNDKQKDDIVDNDTLDCSIEKSDVTEESNKEVVEIAQADKVLEISKDKKLKLETDEKLESESQKEDIGVKLTNSKLDIVPKDNVVTAISDISNISEVNEKENNEIKPVVPDKEQIVQNNDIKAKVLETNQLVETKLEEVNQIVNVSTKVEEVNQIDDDKAKDAQVNPISNVNNKVNLEVLNTASSIILDADTKVDATSISAEN